MQSVDDLDRCSRSRRRDSTLARLGREEHAYPLRDSIMPIEIVCLLIPTSFDIILSSNMCPRKPGAPYR